MSPAPPRGTALLGAYLAATGLAPGLVLRAARRAHAAQGADPARRGEREGRATLPRPEGALVWVHAASVGEVLAVRDLLADLAAAWPGVAILVTTVTATGAAAVGRAGIAGALHQFLPADTPGAVAAFAGHWRPDLAVIVESDIWPRLLGEMAGRGVPCALINARRSRTRARVPRTMAALLGQFRLITAQDAAVAAGIVALGVPEGRVVVAGDLKADADPLPDRPEERQALVEAFGGRPLWSAVSTHAGDEAAVLDAHAAVLRQVQGAALVLVPRHPDRAEAIAEACRARGLGIARRSRDERPGADCAVYLADTIGETGVFFRLSAVVFLGGSFGREGGHNPYEPLRLGAAVLHGPGVRHFAAAYGRLDAAGAARMVADGAALGGAVAQWLGDRAALEAAGAAGARALAGMGGARAATLARLLALAGRAL
jgi:3-deoxy-D-manno-octulosonic-acid transferase